MSLNTDQPGHDLFCRDTARRSASWAALWLGEHLWAWLTGEPDDDYAEWANTCARVVHGLRAPAGTLPLLIAAELR